MISLVIYAPSSSANKPVSESYESHAPVVTIITAINLNTVLIFCASQNLSIMTIIPRRNTHMKVEGAFLLFAGFFFCLFGWLVGFFVLFCFLITVS